MKKSPFLKRIRESRLFWPLVALALILLFDAFFAPSFFKIGILDGHLYGNLIDVLNDGAPLALVAIGMTLVIATGGVDLSVGAVIAISAAMGAVLINPALGNQADHQRYPDQGCHQYPLVDHYPGRPGGRHTVRICGMGCWCPGPASSRWSRP